MGGRAVQCLMYADDIALVAETGSDLPRMLDALHAYCRRWQMFVNVPKTEVVVFRRGGEVTESFSYAGKALQVVDFFRYLGVIFSRDGKVDQAIQTRVSAANKVFGMFVRRVTAWMFDPYMGSRMVTTYVRPVLLYGSEVWGVRRRAPLEAVLKDAGRLLLGVPKHTPVAAVLGELGWMPVWATAQLATVRYVFGLVAGQARGKIVCRALSVAVSMGRRGVRGTWGLHLREMLQQLGLERVWQAMAGQPLDQLKWRAIGENWQCAGADQVRLLAEKEWRQAIDGDASATGQGGNKLRCYRLVKTGCELEQYLRVVRQFPVRRLVTRLRAGVLRLRLEEGRQEARRAATEGRELTAEQKLALRHCPFCPGRVESEVHFVTECPVYQAQRNRLWQIAGDSGVRLDGQGAEQQYAMLLASDMPGVLTAVARFVQGAWDVRSQRLTGGGFADGFASMCVNVCVPA